MGLGGRGSQITSSRLSEPRKQAARLLSCPMFWWKVMGLTCTSCDHPWHWLPSDCSAQHVAPQFSCTGHSKCLQLHVLFVQQWLSVSSSDYCLAFTCHVVTAGRSLKLAGACSTSASAWH